MEKDRKNEDILEKRKKNIKNKFNKLISNKYDKLAFLVIILSAIFRFYWLFKTKTQALWFDEGTYLVQARAWALGTPAYPEPARDYFISFIWSIFIKLGFGELGLRILTVTLGILSLLFFYYIVSYFFNKKAGLFSMILASVFYEAIFWSLRLDIGTYSIFFMLISLFFFVKGMDTKKLKFYLLASAFAVFSLLSHAAGIFIILFYIIFIPINSKFKFYKNKKFYIILLCFFLVISPFLIRNIIVTGKIYPRYQIGWVERGGTSGSFLEAMKYIKTLPQIIGLPSFLIFLIGLFLSLDIFLILDRLWKNYSKETQGKLFFLIFGLISLSLGIQSLLFNKGGAYFEPRYIIPFYLACFAFAGIGLNFIFNKIKKYNKFIAIIFVILLLGYISYIQLNKSSDLIELKTQGYQGIKQAGLWLNQNSNPGDKIVSFETPQIIYYSNRQGLAIPRENEEVRQLIINEKAKYLLVWAGFGMERINDLLAFIEKNNQSIIPRQGFPANSQPTTVIYEIKDYSLIL